jgi:hypothetical protein
MRDTAEPEYASTFGTTDQSGSHPSTSDISNSNNNSRTDSSSENERNRIIRELETSIETFREGKTTKTNVISSILRILGENTHVSISESQKEATFDSYLTEIISIQSTFDESGKLRDPELEHQEENTTPNENISKRKVKKTKESGELESDNEDDKPSKKQKLLESDMPWFIESDDSSPDSGNPNCQETCRLLRAYNHDIPKAKFFIKIAPKSPSGIPSSQWERILKGDAVDLNQIFASLHHVIPDEERTGRLGDTEISFGVSEAKKRINSASEWSSAWRRASKAISFAFPHRKEELLEYGDYIESEFAAKLVSSHHKLLLYDVALRNEVAGGQHILLTDNHKFTRLYSVIVLPDGVETSSKQGNGRKPSSPQQGGSKPEICNKFNIGTCKNSDADCKYRHICKGCNKSGHSKKDCPDGTR